MRRIVDFWQIIYRVGGTIIFVPLVTLGLAIYLPKSGFLKVHQEIVSSVILFLGLLATIRICYVTITGIPINLSLGTVTIPRFFNLFRETLHIDESTRLSFDEDTAEKTYYRDDKKEKIVTKTWLLYLHGAFGSRRISFFSKQKRDETTFLLKDIIKTNRRKRDSESPSDGEQEQVVATDAYVDHRGRREPKFR